MKTKLTLALMSIFMLVSTLSFASFPVERNVVTTINTTTTVEESTTTVTLSSPAAAALDEEMWIAAALWFFLGGFAAHRWYLGSPWYWNVLFIITLGGIGIWWLVDGIQILSDNW
ncbi:TM2 domain-containing protein [Nonlabens ulvanivorans]|uniref:TM2 domain-containing protein n=1 Tax=Nonlabens ulvanivorans TaxID=906888 RepID=UPI0037C9DCFE